MKSLLHGRIELVEVYVEMRAVIDDGALDLLVDITTDGAVVSASANFRPPIDIVVHVARGSGHGVAATCRVTIATSVMAAAFPRAKSLESEALELDRRGTRLARDLFAAIARAFGARAIGRKEHRRKAPGKIRDLLQRMKPAGVLGVASIARLAAREKSVLSDHSAALMRSVHSPELFRRLMERLKRETSVAFVPSNPADFENLASKLVGVSDREQRLHRRQARPRFKSSDPGVSALAARLTLGRGPLRTAWFSS